VIIIFSDQGKPLVAHKLQKDIQIVLQCTLFWLVVINKNITQ